MINQFVSNVEYCEYINNALPASFTESGFKFASASVFNSIGKCIAIDIRADVRGLQEFKMNNKINWIFMLHGSPETHCEEYKFELVHGMHKSLMAEMGIRRPSLRKCEGFKEAADALIKWFVKNESVIIKTMGSN